MAEKTKFTEADLIHILSEYRLGEFRGFTPFSAGTVQTNLLLETNFGKYVFRCYENRSAGSARFECNLIEYLKAHQYPCPAVYKNKHGDFVGIFREKPYAIFEFIEGRHIEHPTEEQKKQLIRKAAELHNITKHYRPAALSERWNYGIPLCRELARRAAQDWGTPAARRKLEWHETELANLRLPNSLPKGVCHCDFHFSNVLFQGDTFAALIDFDDANYTFLLFDLVGLIESAAWRHDQDTVLNFTRAREVVDEYSKYRPLSPLEKTHLFDVYKLSILFDAIWYFRRGSGVDFYEKRKIDFLNGIGRETFTQTMFHERGAIPRVISLP